MAGKRQYCPWDLLEAVNGRCPVCTREVLGEKDVAPWEVAHVSPSRFDDRFQLTGVVGRGGMSVVYRAWDDVFRRLVAIKFLCFPDHAISNRAYEQFKHEARTMAGLGSTHVPVLYDFDGGDPQRPYLVMELLRGETLAGRIARGGILDARDLVEWVLPVLDVLELAHGQRIVHRDLKPENIFRHQQGDTPQVKVLDFGISQLFPGNPARTLRMGQQIVYGTPEYMAPEQLEGQPPEPGNDVYSLGVSMYEALTGLPPFRSPDPRTVARMHQEATPPPLPDRPGCRKGMQDLVLDMLSKSATARPRVMAVIRDRLLKAAKE
jgi:eukaryotic-like serine/threonine-protein kinase